MSKHTSTFSKRLRQSALALAIAGVLSPVAGTQAAAGANFGVAAAVHGNAQIIPAGQSRAVSLKSGMVISEGDRIVTHDESGLQVLLTDETVFTLGGSTSFVLSSYAYDPETSTGRVNGKVEKGSFKLVTGRIADTQPGNVTVDMPTGRVTLLGTVIAGDTDGDSDTVVLLGPGGNVNSTDKEGKFQFENTGSGEKVLVTRDGFFVDSEGNVVSEPAPMTGREFGQLVASLARAKGGEGDDPSGGDSAEDESGSGGDDSFASLGDPSDAEETEEGAQDGLSDVEALIAAQDTTTLEDLMKVVDANVDVEINDFKGSFSEVGLEMTEGGTFDYRFEFSTAGKDLANQTLLDFIGFENIDAAGIAGGELSWDTAVDGEPAFTELAVSSDDDTLVSKGTCVDVCTGSVTVLNAGQGNVAKFHIVALEVDNAGTTDSFEEAKLVKPGGNRNFPGTEITDVP